MNLDTNSIQQAGDVVLAVKSQVSNWWPMIAPLAYILGREIRAFNAWARNVAEFCIAHGGVFLIAKKLLWNPPVKIIALLLLVGNSGCAVLKEMAPNSWNATYYEPTDGSRSGQTIAVGVSGALPFGKQ